MLQIDRLFGSMTQRGATRAIVVGGQPLQMVVGEQTVSGVSVSGEMLHTMLAEALPPEFQAQLGVDGQFETIHPAPQGAMRLWVSRHNGITTLVVDQMPTPSVAPAPAPTSNPYNTGTVDNSSGAGVMAPVPPEIQGRWNWGAFLLSWIWGIGNNTWIALLCFVPFVGLVMPFMLGAKGNEWAWRNRRFGGVDDFKRVQTSWAWAGLVVQGALVLPALFFVLVGGSILGPVGARAHANAGRSSSQSNLKQIGLSVILFSQDHNDKYPPGRTAAQWQTSLAPYMKTEGLFVSPSTGEPYSLNPVLSDKSLAELDSVSTMPMFYEAHVDSLGGHNIGFADGHVKWMSEKNWPAYRTYLDSVGGE